MQKYIFYFFLAFNLFNTNLQIVHARTTVMPKIESFPSSEYRIGLYQDLILDRDKITHILVIGSAVKQDSDQFFQSGISRAYRYKELYPGHQVVIMSSPDVLNTPDEDVFFKYNVTVISKILEKFTAKNMLNEMNLFNRIASFDFFGHSSPWAMKIGDINAAFSPNEHLLSLKLLKTKFLPNSYVTLNSCNTGFIAAPELSKILEIPVSGALTSSVFEKIQNDGHWYKENDYSGKTDAYLNKYSYNQALYCSMGLCNRMKPSRENYSSVWGYFAEGGLSFNKFFCNFDNSDGRCERGMANSLYAFPSVLPLNSESNSDKFEAVVFDWICSTGKKNDYFSKCVNGIKEAIARYDLVFQGHPSNELMCDFQSCHAKVICKKNSDNDPRPGTCHLKTVQNPEPTNAAREYLSLMKGFEDLKKYNTAPVLQ